MVCVKLRDSDTEFINRESISLRRTRSSIIRGALSFCFDNYSQCIEYIKKEIDIPRKKLKI
ncbi:MAG: hypothetical protein QXX52_08155 [Ignisphaera sp.]